MARPTARESPPAGRAGARDDVRTDRADDDFPVGPDGAEDGFVFVGPGRGVVAEDA